MAVQDNLQEARRLSATSQSCIRKVENQLTLMVHPLCSSELKKGVLQELDSLSRRYSKVLGGIIMAYENVQLISSQGWLFDTNPFNHVIIQAQFYVFSPEVGSVLEGVVKKKTLNHIGCLVHGMFNVSVPKPFDTSVDDWCGTYSEEGDAVKLTITLVSMANFLPYITAELDPECIQELVNSRTQENAVDVDTTDGALRQNRRVVFDDDSGISISELEESLDNTEKEAEKQGSSFEYISKACKGENNVNEDNQKVKGRKRKRQNECFDVSQGEGDMAFTKKKKKRKNTNIAEENIDWNANEEFKDSSPKTTKKRKKNRCKDQSSNEDIGPEKNIEDGLQSSRDTEHHKEEEVQVPSLLKTIKDGLKKSRNKNKEISRSIEEKQSIIDWNAEEEFKDSSPKTTKKRKKNHCKDQSSNEDIGPEKNIEDGLQSSRDTEHHKEEEVQVPSLLRTIKDSLKKSRNKNKEISRSNEEKQSIIDWNAEEEFKDSSPKTTKKRKKNHCKDQSSNEDIGPEKNIEDGLQSSRDTEHHKEEEVQVPSLLRTIKDSLKKSRNKNKEISRSNEEKQSIIDWNAEEEFKDSTKTTKKRKKKHYMDQSSNEDIGLEQDVNGRLRDSKETKHLKENEFEISVLSRTSEGTLKKSRNGIKKIKPKNSEEKESLNSPRVTEVHETNSIKNWSPLSPKSAEVNVATPEQTKTTQSSSSRKLKDSNMTSQREKKTLSLPQELEMSSIITPKRNTKSPSRRKSKDLSSYMDSMFLELPLPDLELDFEPLPKI